MKLQWTPCFFQLEQKAAKRVVKESEHCKSLKGTVCNFHYFCLFVHKTAAIGNSLCLPVSMMPVRNSSLVLLTPLGNYSPVPVEPVRNSTIASLTPHCPKNGSHITFYGADAKDVILYGP
jgi:hypothetical protein